MTVLRAIEDTNPLCTAECTALYGDGSGRCRQHDNTNGLDVCWAHSIHNVTGAEYCSKGLGVLVSEAIEEYLCPDASLQEPGSRRRHYGGEYSVHAIVVRGAGGAARRVGLVQRHAGRVHCLVVLLLLHDSVIIVVVVVVVVIR